MLKVKVQLELQLATCKPPTTLHITKHAACVAHQPRQQGRFLRTAGEKHFLLSSYKSSYKSNYERSQQAAGSPSNRVVLRSTQDLKMAVGKARSRQQRCSLSSTVAPNGPGLLPARADHPVWRSGDPSGNAVPAGGVIAHKHNRHRGELSCVYSGPGQNNYPTSQRAL